MAWNLDNSFVDYDFTLRIPARNLYSDFCFVHTSTPSTTYYSAIHHVHPSPVPLDDQARLWIKLNADTLDRRENLGIVEIKKTGKSSWIGGDYKRRRGSICQIRGKIRHRYRHRSTQNYPTPTRKMGFFRKNTSSAI